VITLKEAQAAGKDDRADGLSDVELENAAESFVENFGGIQGQRFAAAYRKGAGI